MREAPDIRYALVRGFPTTYKKCLTDVTRPGPVDLSLARKQHVAYCKTLRASGLELIWLEPDDRFPDCCFVEDPAIIAGETAIVCRMGAPSRVGEEAAVRETLRAFKEIREIVSPGTLEGGDVLQIDDTVYVGLTRRTNRSGLDQLSALLSGRGWEVVPVGVNRGLHLKSSCTYIGDGTVVLAPGGVEEKVFSGYNTIEVPGEEAAAADCLRVRDKVLVLEGYPGTQRRIEAEGFETIALPMSEFERCDGGLTCLSIVF